METSKDIERLSQLKDTFQLSDFQLAHLLGADRTALRHWRRVGIPKRRIADLEALERLADAVGAQRARTIMHWPDPRLNSKSPLLAVRLLSIVEICTRLSEK